MATYIVQVKDKAGNVLQEEFYKKDIPPSVKSKKLRQVLI